MLKNSFYGFQCSCCREHIPWISDNPTGIKAKHRVSKLSQSVMKRPCRLVQDTLAVWRYGKWYRPANWEHLPTSPVNYNERYFSWLIRRFSEPKVFINEALLSNSYAWLRIEDPELKAAPSRTVSLLLKNL